MMNKALQIHNNLSPFCLLETTQYSRQMCGPMNSHKVSNYRPYDYASDTVRHNHRYHSGGIYYYELRFRFPRERERERERDGLLGLFAAFTLSTP